MRNIRQNLFFALAYNTVGIPVAAGLLYPFLGIRLSPIIAAAAMALSSLSVVTNANRLRRWHPTPLPYDKSTAVTPQVRLGTATQASTQAPAAPMSAAASVDPVCGMTVSPDTAAASRDIEGTSYYFCSTHCAASFDANPHRYTATATPK